MLFEWMLTSILRHFSVQPTAQIVMYINILYMHSGTTWVRITDVEQYLRFLLGNERDGIRQAPKQKHSINIILIHIYIYIPIHFIAFGTWHLFVEWISNFHSLNVEGELTELNDWLNCEWVKLHAHTRTQWTIFFVSPSVNVCFWYITWELKCFLVQFEITYRWALLKSKIVQLSQLVCLLWSVFVHFVYKQNRWKINAKCFLI